MNKILMVEPEVTTVQKSQERLSQAGFELLTAHDGAAGLQIAKDKTPDLIITDAFISGLSGYELCKAIKHEEAISSTPIIVITEKHRMEDSFMFLGVKNFLNKPVSMDEMESVVRNVLDLTQRLNLQKSKILVYGRSEVVSCCQQLLKADTHWMGYYSANSASFLEAAIKHAPDVLLMDLLMPGTPTDELIKRIKLVPELKNTVILTYYASDSISQDQITVQAQMIEVQYMKLLTQEAGAKEYLGAFNPVTFLNLINIYRKDFEII